MTQEARERIIDQAIRLNCFMSCDSCEKECREPIQPGTLTMFTMFAEAHLQAIADTDYVIVPRGPGQHRHRQRGTVYEVLGDVRIQCPADQPLRDDEIVRLYRDVDSGHYGARRHAEFDDGRFEEMGK